MTIICTAAAILAWFGINAIEKHEDQDLRKRLEQYGPGEVVA